MRSLPCLPSPAKTNLSVSTHLPASLMFSSLQCCPYTTKMDGLTTPTGSASGWQGVVVQPSELMFCVCWRILALRPALAASLSPYLLRIFLLFAKVCLFFFHAASCLSSWSGLPSFSALLRTLLLATTCAGSLSSSLSGSAGGRIAHLSAPTWLSVARPRGSGLSSQVSSLAWLFSSPGSGWLPYSSSDGCLFSVSRAVPSVWRSKRPAVSLSLACLL